MTSARHVKLMFGMEISCRQTRLAREAFEYLESDLMSIAFGMRCKQVSTARLLAEIEQSGHHLRRGCSSMAEYGEKNGYSGREAVMLAAVGRALELRPALKEEILTGSLTLEAAAALGHAADRASETGNTREREPPPGGLVSRRPARGRSVRSVFVRAPGDKSRGRARASRLNQEPERGSHGRTERGG